MPLPWANRKAAWSLEGVPRPWPEDRPALLPFIREHMSGEGVYDGSKLPDEEWVNRPMGLKFVPGLFDRMWWDDDEGEPEARANRVLSLLHSLEGDSSARRLRELYDELVDHPPGGILGLVEDVLTTERLGSAERLQAIGRVLALEAADRDTVKLGVVLLGLMPLTPQDVSLIVQLGRHEDFTGYAARAIRRQSEAWERHVWELGRCTKGWGRSEAIEVLDGTNDKEIGRRLLRLDWSERMLGDESPLICARTGNLLAALADPDDELLAVIDDLIRALGGVGFDKYQDGAPVLERYLDLVAGRPISLEQFLIADRVKFYLEGGDADRDERASRGWTADRIERMAAICDGILNQPGWREMAEAALLDPERETQLEGLWAARILGIDTWDYWLPRAQAESAPGLWVWQSLVPAAGPDRLDDLLGLALEKFSPGLIVSGVKHESALWREPEFHGALDWVLDELAKFPGQGWQLVQTGLRSTSFRNRLRAARTLEGWPKGIRTPGVMAAIVEARDDEPDAEVRDMLDRLAKGLPPLPRDDD